MKVKAPILPRGASAVKVPISPARAAAPQRPASLMRRLVEGPALRRAAEHLHQNSAAVVGLALIPDR